MNTILALDASGESCSVSLRLAGGKIATLASEEPRAHAAKLLPFIDQLLADAGIGLASVDSIACAVGPGSFTGLRIALGVAQGLAYGAGLPIIPVCTLAALVGSKKSAQQSVYIPLLDARMHEVYWGAYRTSQEPVDDTLLARVSGAAEFETAITELAAQYSLIAIGDAWRDVPFAKPLLSKLNLAQDVAPSSLSESVAELAVFSTHQYPPHEVDLLYCRNSVAWDKRQRIRS